MISNTITSIRRKGKALTVASTMLVGVLDCGSLSALTNANIDDPPLSNSVVFIYETGCTGTLIAPQIVVSAGHCFHHNPPSGVTGLPDGTSHYENWEQPGVWYPLFDYPNGVTVVFGNDRINPDFMVTAHYYNHPGYADVILLGLDDPVPADIAEPVEVMTDLPHDTEPEEFWQEETFDMVGWGTTGDGMGQPVIRRRAQSTFRESSDADNPNRFYVDGVSGSMVRSGDSGGPLLWVDPQGLRHLVGIVQGENGNGVSRYFAPWVHGGVDINGKQRPDLSAWFQRQLRPSFGWTPLDLGLDSVTDVAACQNGNIMILKNDHTVYVTSGLPTQWASYLQLPADVENITCANNELYFQKTNRTLWKFVDSTYRYVGFPWAAAEISGSENDVTGSPSLWALNENRSLWVNDNGGKDESWRKVGTPWAAQNIASTRRKVVAVNTDGSLWFNQHQGADGKWKRVGFAPENILDVTAASVGQMDQMYLYAAVSGTNEVMRGAYAPGTRIPVLPESGDSDTFEAPMYGDMRLDSCFGSELKCGQSVAQTWCRLKGYDEAGWYRSESLIGKKDPTYFLGTGQSCNWGYCEGFAEITCNKL